MVILANVIYRLTQLLILIVLIDIILTYFVSPWNKVRQFLDRIVEPMLWPIRKIVKPMGGLDFSPVILVILIQIIGSLLRTLILSL
jgi:YggT family protein